VPDGLQLIGAFVGAALLAAALVPIAIRVALRTDFVPVSFCWRPWRRWNRTLGDGFGLLAAIPPGGGLIRVEGRQLTQRSRGQQV
jgi:hypothetical protein